MKIIKFLICSFLLLIAPFAHGADREISVKGDVEFKIKISGVHASVKGTAFDGAQLVKDNDGWILKAATGASVSEAHSMNKDEVHLTKGESTQYIMKTQDQGYSVFLPSDELLNRVKVKEDKFNLYDKSATRLFHGKQKDDGFGVKNEKDEQTIKVKGAESLREASCFALQIPPEYQVVFWAVENLKN